MAKKTDWEALQYLRYWPLSALFTTDSEDDTPPATPSALIPQHISLLAANPPDLGNILYFYRLNDSEHGPCTLEYIRQLARSYPALPIRKADELEARPARDHAELADLYQGQSETSAEPLPVIDPQEPIPYAVVVPAESQSPAESTDPSTPLQYADEAEQPSEDTGTQPLYFCQAGGQKFGPITLEKLRIMRPEPYVLVQRVGKSQPTPAGQLPELGDLYQQSPAGSQVAALQDGSQTATLGYERKRRKSTHQDLPKLCRNAGTIALLSIPAAMMLQPLAGMLVLGGILTALASLVIGLQAIIKLTSGTRGQSANAIVGLIMAIATLLIYMMLFRFFVVVG